MLERLKTFLKRNRLAYKLYYYVLSASINLMKIFVKTDEKLILFVSFGGRRICDSPYAIYEQIRKDKRFHNYKLVWAINDITRYPDIEYKVRIDSLKYFITALKARCWITNVLVERALNFSGKNTFYLYTDHGAPIKKVGKMDDKTSFHSMSKDHFDAALAQSQYERKIRASFLSLTEEKVYLTGIPTNDILANYTKEYRKEIREKLGISSEKKVILYAPTFREYDSIGKFDMPLLDMEKWRKALGDEYVLLYRAHPISKTLYKDDEFVIDVSGYDSIESLMIASDVLVSDYSGLIPDYSILNKPIFLYVYDYDRYTSTRGLYIDIANLLPSSIDEDIIIQMIKNGYTSDQMTQLKMFKSEFAQKYGNASELVTDLIAENIGL